jgi:hypothetical protein
MGLMREARRAGMYPAKRERAYALYESRGRKSGEDEQDWLRAEQETLKP